MVVHNNIDQHSAIGKLAMWATKVALEADYDVIAVAKDLDSTLEGEVQYRPLHVPRAVFAYQWARAHSTVKAALSSASYDLFHTFQPQLTGIADTWHVQFLTRSAEQTGSFPRGKDALARWRRSQLRIVARMEDRYLKRLSSSVDVLFPSQLMLDEFTKHYGQPPRYQLLPNPSPAIVPLTAEDRRRARQELIGSFDGTVVGYLGGLEDRKGWRELADGVAATPDAFLLFGGPDSVRFRDDRLSGRCHAYGFVHDLTGFLAACDVLAVPSSFDPCPLVVTEAASRGVPSITTPMVGAQEQVMKFGAGVAWDGRAETFPNIVNDLSQGRANYEAGALAMAEALSEGRLSESLLQSWSQALEHRLRRQAPAS